MKAWRHPNRPARRTWGRIRVRVIERAAHRCETCGMAGRFEIHHVVSLKDGGSNDLDNLIALCRTCHLKVHTSWRPEREAWRAFAGELLSG